MSTLYGLLAVAGILAGEMKSEDWQTRESATQRFCQLVNEYDAPHLVTPLLLSDNPEVRTRALFVYNQYFHPLPTNKSASHPKINSYDGVNEEIWKVNFYTAYYAEMCYKWSKDGKSLSMTPKTEWKTFGSNEEVRAAKHFIREKWVKERLTRNEVVAILDSMVQNERKNTLFMLPNETNPYYGYCPDYEVH